MTDGAGGVLLAPRWVLLACNGVPSLVAPLRGTHRPCLGLAAAVVVAKAGSFLRVFSAVSYKVQCSWEVALGKRRTYDTI